MNRIHKGQTARGFFNIGGSFGEVFGSVLASEEKIVAKNDIYCATLDIEKHESGVSVQTGSFKNVSDKEIIVKTLMSRFVFPGGEWEVYTQYNGWQNESKGVWQDLNTKITAEVGSVRSSAGAVPFMALWNKATNRGFAFHLLAHSSWEMSASKTFDNTTGEKSYVVIDLGISRKNFNVKLEAGEEIEIPKVLFYSVENKLDLDSYKLQGYYRQRTKKSEMPIVYNTWLYKFDRIDFENVQSQIKKAAEIGAEYFVIDAGWFGKGKEWWGSKGDWKENMTFGFKGRMREVSQMIRDAGLKFGFWLEIESAGNEADILEQYPDYFIEYNGMYFLDFANPKACEYITDKVAELVERFDAKYIKFDFNQDMLCDKAEKAFLDYHKGHRQVMRAIRERCPEVYLENCASGGLRMDLTDADLFDSYWISDNHSPYEGMRIYKETLRRMPPQMMEKWATIRSVSDFEPNYMSTKDKILSSHDCAWFFAVELKRSFLNGFIKGGPFGISTDLNLLSADTFEFIKNAIAEYKNEREFWRNAVCRIIADSDSVYSFEYSSPDFDEIKILTFSEKRNISSIIVYPVLDFDAEYEINGKTVSAADIKENGIDIEIADNFECAKLELKKK